IKGAGPLPSQARADRGGLGLEGGGLLLLGPIGLDGGQVFEADGVNESRLRREHERAERVRRGGVAGGIARFERRAQLRPLADGGKVDDPVGIHRVPPLTGQYWAPSSRTGFALASAQRRLVAWL